MDNICKNENCYHSKDSPKCHKLEDADYGYDEGKVQCWWWQKHYDPQLTKPMRKPLNEEE